MIPKTSKSQHEIEAAQREFCREHSLDFVASSGFSKMGFALSTKGKVPINGLRHPPQGDTNGWYLWCGERYSVASDFFQPLHTQHVYDEFPNLIKLLGLPPGYRFLLAGDYLDVWYDPSLLRV
jgi:hypothetical protein